MGQFCIIVVASGVTPQDNARHGPSFRDRRPVRQSCAVHHRRAAGRQSWWAGDRHVSPDS